ncbi:MAG: FAD-binding oxidoreductase, partial [Leptolyngbya sp. SIO1D8]|nr:FAD-binding oxidoreductase [Leptolyngbya sp. SIO1D8]
MVAQLNTPESQRDWAPILNELEALLGKDSVVRRKEELLVYECDGLTSYRQRPPVVVLPRTTEQVAAAIKVCDRHNVPLATKGT